MRQGKVLNLDEKDRLILNALQENAGLSYAELSKMVGLTKMSIYNRIANLRKARVIKGTYYRVDPSKVNMDYLMISQISCEVSGPEQEKIAEKIADVPGVQSVYLNFGQYDILMIARRSDRESAKDLLYQVSRLPGIRSTYTMVPHTVVKETLEVKLH